MPCPHCGFANADGMNFCGRCGTKLPQACPACGFMNPSEHTFCGKCGVRLQDTTRVSEAAQEVPQHTPSADQTSLTQLPAARSSGLEAERRQLTVLFCDLVDSTVLSSQLDPEDLREVIRAYQAACAEVVQRIDGHIAQYLGDGLLVYFGYPHAHEDDAQRAVRAGLEIIDAMQQCNVQLRPRMRVLQTISLRVRLGIHTGLAVVGDIGAGGRQEQLALGETPNVAARLQSLAAPDTVVISAATARLVAGYFTVHDLGVQPLKGVTTPLQVYRVLGESGARSRLEVTNPRGLTPLVGRESEVALLRERWTQVQEGLGQVVLLSGEAGIGKSRLVRVLQEQVEKTGATRIEYRCSSYHQHSPLYPVITHLQRVLAFAQDDAPEAKLDKLERVLAPHALPLAETVPLLASLLMIPLPARYPPLTLTPQRQKQKTLVRLSFRVDPI